MRNLQEIFNIAYLGLASQGFERSVDETEVCAYRSKDGKMCAIGYCISDEDYSVEMEGKGVEFGKVYRAVKTHVNEDTLVRLQLCHDDANSPKDMVLKLKKFADQHKLTIPKEPTL